MTHHNHPIAIHNGTTIIFSTKMQPMHYAAFKQLFPGPYTCPTCFDPYQPVVRMTLEQSIAHIHEVHYQGSDVIIEEWP